MRIKNLLLALFAFVVLQSCSAPKSNTIPDYAATRVRVNTGSAQSASLETRSRAVEIKNTQDELDELSAQVRALEEKIVQSRMKLAR